MKSRHICPHLANGCKRAAALLLVLWAVFVMSTVVVVAIRLVDFDLDLESLARKRFTARQLALSGLAYAQHPKIERGDPLLWQVFPNGDRIEVRIESEDAKLNLNILLAGGNTTALTRLFRYWGVSENEAAVAVDSLKDWVDKDDFRGLNGAEASDLPEGSPYSRPENRPFLNVAEMRTVRGMEAVARVKPDWRDYFSVRSSNRLDLQDTSGDLLEVFGLLSPDQVRSFLEFRAGPDGKPSNTDDPKIDSVETLAAVIPLNPVQIGALRDSFGSGSKLRHIVSRGISGGAVHEISAVAAEGANGEFLEWRE